MTIEILERAGLNPSFLVGGISSDFGVSSRYTSSDYFVIEADEYDTAFFDKRSKLIHYDPAVLVINNIEFDHADIFKDIDAIYWQFHQLLRRIPSNASIVYNAADENVQKIIEMGCWANTVKTNVNDGVHIASHKVDYSEFEIQDGENKLNIKWNFIGEHNAQNAISAYSAAKQVGVSNDDIIAALCSSKGVKRRLENIYKDQRVALYDDFAHHPTSIKLILDAVRNRNPNEYVVALIDPRSNTMKSGNNKDALPCSLLKADKVLFYNHKLLQWDAKQTLENLNNVVFLDNATDFEISIKEIVSNIRDKKIEMVMMSNGSFDGLRESLPKLLGELNE